MVEKVDIRTRFLFPYLFSWTVKDTLVRECQAVEFARRPVWEVMPDPLDDYLDNTLPFLHPALFDPGNPNSGRYLRVRQEIVEFLLGDVEVVLQLQTPIRASIDPSAGIELFITAYGVAVFSVALQATQSLRWSEAREFNAQLHYGTAWEADGRCARIVPTATTKDRWPKIGLSDHSMTLPAIMQRLLPGINSGDKPSTALQSVQRSFSVYTVVRCSADVDLRENAIREEVEPEIAALQGVWRSSHAGIANEAWSTKQAVLNRRHWLAIGHQGVVHLVADQPSEDGEEAVAFNDRRAELALTKHFFQYLVPWLQRLSLQSFTAEIEEILGRAITPADARELAGVRMGLLDFSLRLQPYQLSNEDLSSRVYRMGVEALGVPSAWNHLRQVLAEVDAQQNAVRQETIAKTQVALNEQMADSLDTVASIQNKVEWVEAFVISVYAVELAHLVGEGMGLDRHNFVYPFWYPGGSLFVVAAVTFGLAVWALELLQQHKPSRIAETDNRIRTNGKRHWGSIRKKILGFTIGLGIVLGHLALGKWCGHPLEFDDEHGVNRLQHHAPSAPASNRDTPSAPSNATTKASPQPN